MKKISNIFLILAIVSSHLMCINVTAKYYSLQCGMLHKGYSGGPDLAFLLIIPYIILIIILLGFYYFFKKR